MEPVSRRRLLQAGLTAPFVASWLASRRRVGAGAAPAVHPRSDWGAGLPSRGPLEHERPEDVRFLLVHHSVSPNDLSPEAVPEELRSFYRLHTSPEKGWPDLAYNFLVDRFGGIWEGRAGSIEGPVKGDATGGSQGFAQLCCFIGDHRTEPPSAEAQTSMVALLAWLASRYNIDPRPGATTSFVSRGSNRWPAGTTVTTTTIAGHRDMSKTVCPGDAAYRLVRNDFPARVASSLGLGATPSPETTVAPSSPTTTTDTVTTSSSAIAGATTTSRPVSTAPSSSTSSSEIAGRRIDSEDGQKWLTSVAVVAGVLTVAIGIRLRTRDRE